MQRLALALYSLLAWLAIPLLKRKLARRARQERGYAQAVPERFGRYASAFVPDDRPLVWMHAVSLGETRAAAIVLGPLREQMPRMRLLLTHGTATGRAEGAKLLRDGDVQTWLPWDTPGAVRRFLRHFRPSVGVLMETELWPNLVLGCRAAGMPLVLANARLNARSHAGALRLAWLARPAYGALTAVWAQTQADAERLRALGAPVQGIFGNVKFDAQPAPELLAHGRAWRNGLARPVVLLASSREGEEAAWLDIYKQNRAETRSDKARTAINVEDVQWLIVPRHPQRFERVARLCEAAGLRVSRRSRWGQAPEAADVWIGDSLGEMPLYYAMASSALLGWSFAPLGGQNLIEAMACGCPVVLGPHTFNFAEAAALAVEAGAAVRVAGMPQGVGEAVAVAMDAARHRDLVARCRGFLDAHRGAAAASARAIARLLA